MTEDNESTAPDADERPCTIVASLGIHNFDGAPEGITEVLGLQPTRSGHAGETSYNVMGKPRGRTHRASFWSLHSQAGNRVSVGEHVANLLEQVRGSRGRFARLPAKATVTVRCTVIPNGDLPLFELEASLLRGLGEIGAGFTLDIISVGEPES